MSSLEQWMDETIEGKPSFEREFETTWVRPVHGCKHKDTVLVGKRWQCVECGEKI